MSQPDIISPAEEEELLGRVKELPSREFQFQGYVGKRRVVSYGGQYDFNQRLLRKADDIPSFLLSLRDKPVFGEVVGISLLSPCRFRLRRKAGTTWERVSVTAEARSGYLLSGPARTEWEHSIPGVEELRNSITFRNFPRAQ